MHVGIIRIAICSFSINRAAKLASQVQYAYDEHLWAGRDVLLEHDASNSFSLSSGMRSYWRALSPAGTHLKRSRDSEAIMPWGEGPYITNVMEIANIDSRKNAPILNVVGCGGSMRSLRINRFLLREVGYATPRRAVDAEQTGGDCALVGRDWCSAILVNSKAEMRIRIDRESACK